MKFDKFSKLRLKNILTGHGFEENTPNHNRPLIQSLHVFSNGVAGCQVEGVAEKYHGVISGVIHEAHWFSE